MIYRIAQFAIGWSFVWIPTYAILLINGNVPL